MPWAVLNALVLFNTRYMSAGVNQLRADDFEARDEDVARLSPFVRRQIGDAADPGAAGDGCGEVAPHVDRAPPGRDRIRDRGAVPPLQPFFQSRCVLSGTGRGAPHVILAGG